MGRNLTEMDKLEAYLKEHGFEYTREDEDNTMPEEQWQHFKEIMGEHAYKLDLHQIMVYKNGRRSWDVICHFGSYGCERGLLEGMGDLFGKGVEGFLTAEDVIRKIEGADDGEAIQSTD